MLVSEVCILYNRIFTVIATGQMKRYGRAIKYTKLNLMWNLLTGHSWILIGLQMSSLLKAESSDINWETNICSLITVPNSNNID